MKTIAAGITSMNHIPEFMFIAYIALLHPLIYKTVEEYETKLGWVP
jgi:hypothetical protein